MEPISPFFPSSESDPFSDIEQTINLEFNELIEAVVRRKEQLLTELKTLREQHKDPDPDLEIVRKIRELETSKTKLIQHCGEMAPSAMKTEMAKSIQKLGQQIDDLERSFAPSSVKVELSCDIQSLKQAISDIGKVFLKTEKGKMKRIQRDYSHIKSPLFRVSNFGSSERRMKNPFGVCIDDSTDLVYIADSGNHRVQVWTLRGDYVSTFCNELLKYPSRIVLVNEALFVSDTDQSSIFKFKRSDFSLLARSEKLAYPCGVCSDSNWIYVSDKTEIVVLNKNLLFSKRFRGCIKECYDIQIRNSMIYALEVDANIIKLIDSDTGYLMNTVISDRDGVRFDFACSFCMDQSGNFLITDWKSDQVKIVAGDGTLLRLIKTSEWKLKKPQGIAVSERQDKVVIVFAVGVFLII